MRKFKRTKSEKEIIEFTSGAKFTMNIILPLKRREKYKEIIKKYDCKVFGDCRYIFSFSTKLNSESVYFVTIEGIQIAIKGLTELFNELKAIREK